MLVGVIEYIVKTLVDKPEQVSVTETSKENSIVIEIRTDEGDIGKVIGKDGKTIRALRCLTHALIPIDKEVNVDVIK